MSALLSASRSIVLALALLTGGTHAHGLRAHGGASTSRVNAHGGASTSRVGARGLRAAGAHGAAHAPGDADAAQVKCPFLARRAALGGVTRSLSELDSSYVLVSVPLLRNLEDMDYWWLGQGSTDAYAVATASPSGLDFHSIVVDNAGGRAPLELHFLVPRDTTSVSVSVYDEDFVTGDDLLGVATLNLANQCGSVGSSGCHFSTKIQRQGQSYHWWHGWRSYTIDAGDVDGSYFVDGGATAARTALKARNVQRTEAQTAIFSPTDMADYLAKAYYYVAEGLGFLVSGLFGDDHVPVSGLYDFQSAGSTDGGITAPGPGPDTTTILAHELASELMEDLGEGLKSDSLYRRNELGVQAFNTAPCQAASRGHDDFREIPAGKTIKSRHRHAP